MEQPATPAKPIINIVEIVEKSGAFKWAKPVDTTIVTSSFGRRINPITGTNEFHNGIDIAAPMGTKAIAIDEGVVLESGNSPTWGIYIKYKINNEYSVFYAHLSSTTASEGDTITKNQTIGHTGSTGLSTGPHLHLTIYENGEEIDPLYFFDYKLNSSAKAEYKLRGETVPEGY